MSIKKERSLFSVEMILYTENIKEPTGKLLQ